MKARANRNRTPWGLLAAALAARLLSLAAVFRQGRVFYFDTDDYYHLRRIMAAAANFPRLPSFDPYLGFPSGFRVNWPPLYDLIVGWTTRIAAGPSPSLHAAQTAAALAPPLAGVATLWLFYKVARRLCGRRAALAALAVAAVLPLLVFYTMAGRPDHHCFENFWFAAVLLGVLNLLDAGGEKERAWTAVAIAASAAAGVMFWIGSELLVAVLLAFATWELTFAARREKPAPRAMFWLGAALLLQGALLLPFGAASAWGRSGAVVFDAPSLFQPVLAAAAGFWVLGLYWRRAEGLGARAASALAAAAAAGLWLAARGAASVRLYLAGQVPVFRFAPEMQPLLAPFGRWGASYAHANFGWAFWTLPPLAWMFARAARRSPARRLAVVWTAACAAPALWQSRYAYELSLPAALLLGWGAVRAARRWNRAVAAAALLILLLPALKNLAELPLSPPAETTTGEDLLDACDWLRERTPPTRSLWRDEGQPEYGVYALHDVGDEVAAIAQRPAAAGNMHYLRAEIEESIAFFLMQDAGQAYDFLRRRRFRYVLLNDLVHNQTLSLDDRLYRWDGAILRANDGVPPPPFWSLVYSRLYVLDGSLTALDGALIAPVEHFRLVYESPNRVSDVSRDKIFEVVPGTRLAGACRVGAVQASVPVVTNQGRSFVYRTLARCATGRYEMTLPYPGTYAVASGPRHKNISVTETETKSGASKALDLD
jgi:asparagine N-glycosylation enzyme membrane subunit Stt3